MLSEAYRERWAEVVVKSQRRSVDWMESLDKAGLLLTDERRKEIQVAVVSGMLERFRQIQPFTLLDEVYGRGHAGSPDDMYKAINEWMSQFLQAIRQT